MKKFYLFIVGALLLSSCIPFDTLYDLSLKNVEVPKNSKQQFSESMLKTTSEDGVTMYSFEDDMIAIAWYATSTQFHFILRNKTNHSIKIPWDEVVYINPYGQSMRCIHSGVRFIDRSNAQVPTVVAKNSTLRDLLMPADLIGREWGERSLFGEYITQEDANQSGFIGTKVSVLLPIMIENVTNEYLFQFELKDIIVE